MPNKDKQFRFYKQKIEYYNEILTYCKFSPRTIHSLMLMVENTNTKSFRTMFDPLVKNGYIKKYDGNVFKNMFTITEKGLTLQEKINEISNDLKLLNNQIGFLTEADMKVRDSQRQEEIIES